MQPPTPPARHPWARVAVVIVTRDRSSDLLTTLARLGELPEAPSVVVVDNGSTDKTVELVRHRHPAVEVVSLGENWGAAGRTVGARLVGAPYVAFSDDDSWWAPGALARAADLLDAHPRLGLLAARVLLGPEGRPDPTCAAMAASPLAPCPGLPLPGPAILGFIACGAVVRRTAYLAVGGFDRHFGVGGEEELLAIDLAAAGWGLTYVEALTAHHHPSPIRNRAARRRIVARNALWVSWLRRPVAVALGHTLRLVRAAPGDPALRAALLEAARGLPWVLRQRRSLPRELESELRRLEAANS